MLKFAFNLLFWDQAPIHVDKIQFFLTDDSLTSLSIFILY